MKIKELWLKYKQWKYEHDIGTKVGFVSMTFFVLYVSFLLLHVFITGKIPF